MSLVKIVCILGGVYIAVVYQAQVEAVQKENKYENFVLSTDDRRLNSDEASTISNIFASKVLINYSEDITNYNWKIYHSSAYKIDEVNYIVQIGVTLSDNHREKWNELESKRMNSGLERLSSSWQTFYSANTETNEVVELMRNDAFQSFFVGSTFQPYGCFWEAPVFFTDLNYDGIAEIFISSGFTNKTDYSDAVYDHVKLNVFDGKTKSKLFETWVVNSDHTPIVFGNEEVSSTGIKSILNDPLSNRLDKSRTGKTALAKMFFLDIDKDDLLDVIIWRRFYVFDNKTKNFEFTHEEFEKREEVAEPYQFAEDKSVANIKEILKQNQLKWQDGFPDRRFCTHKNMRMTRLINDDVVNGK